MTETTKMNLFAMAAICAMIGGCCLLFVSGCVALDRSALINQKCGPGGTNVCIVVVSSEGGAALSLLTGLDTNAWKAIAQGAAAGVTK